MLKRSLGAACASILFLSVCGKETPCSGSSCLPVSGSYLVTFTQPIECGLWEPAINITPSSVMTFTGSGSQLQLTLWPVSDNPHELKGTLNADGTVLLQETPQGELLGIPYGIITGTFQSTGGQPGQPPFYFEGNLTLEGASPTSATSGGATTAGGPPSNSTAGSAGNGCAATVGLNAEEETSTAILDGGPGDAGSSPTDAGADAG